MRLKFLGSGGYLRIPRACCNCEICQEARKKGKPYRRLGQSLFMPYENILFDTPEDINTELNEQGVGEVENLFYSHWHPDHTKGARILEVLRAQNDKSPVKVFLTERLKRDFEERVPELFYYEKEGYCSIEIKNQNSVGEFSVKYIKLRNDFSYAFLMERRGKKTVFCPCHAVDLPLLDKIKDPDLLIMNLGYFGDKEREVTGFKKDNLRLIDQLNAQNTVLTHIEESWGRNYDQYCKLEDKYSDMNLRFAYDGLEIEV